MKFIKILLFLACIVVQSSIIKSEKTRAQKFIEFLYQPTTILSVGVTSIGFYTGFNSSLRTEAYSWLKDRWNETPPLIKYSAFFLTGLWFYNDWYQKRILKQNEHLLRQSIMQNAPCENNKLIQDLILRIHNMESILGITFSVYSQPPKSKIFFLETNQNRLINEVTSSAKQIHDLNCKVSKLTRQLIEAKLIQQ